MADTPPVAYEQHAKIEVAKRELRAILAGGTLVTIVLVTMLCCMTTYCTSPTLVDYEAQAKRVIEARNMQVCVARGGSWMPVMHNGYSDMSCVTATTLPLVTKMNKGD